MTASIGVMFEHRKQRIQMKENSPTIHNKLNEVRTTAVRTSIIQAKNSIRQRVKGIDKNGLICALNYTKLKHM